MGKRFLGIDYGEKRVGIAISDENGSIAFPFKILKNNHELLETIHNLCGEQDIAEIVIGESLNFSGQKNTIMIKIDIFKKELLKLNLPIHFEKEFLTTVEAREKQNKSKNNARQLKKEKFKEIDDQAAALILQRYLDRLNLKH